MESQWKYSVHQIMFGVVTRSEYETFNYGVWVQEYYLHSFLASSFVDTVNASSIDKT